MVINKLGDNLIYQKSVNAQNAPDVKGSSDTKNMTMGEYKKYIYNKISAISVNNGSLTEVSISEEGFEAMKNDPEYERWVMNQLSTPSGGESCSVYFVGKNRNDFRTECWRPEDMKKRMEMAEKEREFWKRRRKKEMEAKMEHYAQYKRMLQENSIRKAEIEMNHISGIYDDFQKSPKNLNAVSAYTAVMEGGEEAAEAQSGKTTVSVNVEKRSRQISSAKTSEQIKAVLLLLKQDLAECKGGLEKGWCDESEVQKAEALIRKAEEKQAQIPADDSENSDDPSNDMAFLLNMIM